jgi:hypothetical protein
LLSALAPAPASAAPILLPSGDTGGSCLSVLGVENSNCSLFSFDPLTGSNVFDLMFSSNKDVALLQFFVGFDATFAADASLTGLNSLVGLFSADSKEMYSYFDPTLGAEVQAFSQKSLEGVLLEGGRSYYLAVLADFNGFNGTPTSLLEGFTCDGAIALDDPCLGGGGSLSLGLAAQPQPVPEPGTLALVGGGAIAALVRRRSRKRDERQNVVR